MVYARRLGLVLGIVGALQSLPPVGTASACPGAKRVRWFPLGTVGDDVVVAEIDESRIMVMARGTGKGIGKNLFWVGTLRLRRVTTSGRARPGGISLGKVVARAIYYHLDARRSVARALQRARRIPGFRMFKHPQLVPCAVGGACGPTRLTSAGMAWYLTAAQGKHLVFDAQQLGLLHKAAGSFESDGISLAEYAKRLAVHRYAVAFRWGTRIVLSVLFGVGFDDARSVGLGAPIGWRDEFCRSVVSCLPPAALPSHEVCRSGLSVVPEAGPRQEQRP